MELKDSITYKNLQTAFNYEMSSIGNYNIFSAKASDDILIEFSELFSRIANNNLFIGRRLRNIIMGGSPSTLDNLAEAVSTESYADKNMYRDFSLTASGEGFAEISALFNGIANIKLNHSIMLESAYLDLQTNTVFCKPEETLWICLGCGNIMLGTCAPNICPVCGVPIGYYQQLGYYCNRIIRRQL